MYKNLEDEKRYHKRYYLKNKDRIDARQKEYIDKNYNEVRERARKNSKTPEQRAKSAARQKIIRRKERELTIAHYGGKCECCGENNYEFLCLDHVNGGGNEHRKITGEGAIFVRWLVKNKFPSSVRILCHNCNQAIGSYGYCPHHPEIKHNRLLPPKRVQRDTILQD